MIDYIEEISEKTEIRQLKLLKMVKLNKQKYYDWKKRYGTVNRHSGNLPKTNWILPSKRTAIIKYAKSNIANNNFHLKDGYRRLTYNMLDENVVGVSPSTVYRILKAESLLNIWHTGKKSLKGTGFIQPTKPHPHWHIDIKYVNFRGTFLFLISVIDGFSRTIVHYELRQNMTEYDVELTLQKSFEKFPKAKPRIISDNGSQFISKDFNLFLKEKELTHIRTSVAYPQSNCKIERYHRTINQECLKVNSFFDLDDAKKIIESFVQYYNNKRLHSSLGYLPPVDFLNGNYRKKFAIREEKLKRASENRKAFWSAENAA